MTQEPVPAIMTDPFYQMFGSRVRALREKNDVTQEELGRRIDLSRTSIVNIEKGRQRVLLHQIVEIAGALDAKPAELLPKAVSENREPDLREDVAQLIESIEAETQGS
jgi:transcriptional regulator with XRE-family HTH domain